MNHKLITVSMLLLTGVLLGSLAAAQDSAPSAGGQIRVSRNGHGLEYRGKPIRLVGDSITQGWMELGADFDQRAYIEALGRRGINTVLLWAYIGVVDQVADPRIGYDAPELWPWVRQQGQFDLLRFNEVYFDRLREFVELARDHHVIVVITVHDGWTKTKFDGHPFCRVNGGPLADRRQFVQLHAPGREMPTTLDPAWTPKEKHQYYLERFCDRLLQATADQPNVMYEMFNEGEWYDQPDLRAFQLHFLKFFRARTALPLVVNDDHIGGADFRGEPAADVISLHKPRWDDCPPAREFFEHYQSQFALQPAKPIFFSEPVPEYGGEATRHPGIVRFLWGTLLGGAGVVVQNDASFGFAKRTALAAQAVNRDTVLDLEGHAARFFHDGRLDFAKMRPCGALSSTGICLANPGEEYVVFVPDGQPFTVDLSAAARRPLAVRWYEPMSGKEQAVKPVVGGHAAEPFQPPYAGDAVLHLRHAPPRQ